MFYQLVLLVHLAIVALAFGAVGALYTLRARLAKAQSVSEAQALLAALESTAIAMPFLSIALLATGIALTRMAWSFSSGWIILSIGGLIAMSVIGAAVLKPRGIALGKQLARSTSISTELREQLQDRPGERAELVNVGLSFAVVVEMVMKPSILPGAAIMLTMVLGVVLGSQVLKRAKRGGEYGLASEAST